MRMVLALLLAPNWEEPDQAHMIDDFDNIREELIPDYIILITDRSASLEDDDPEYDVIGKINPGYTNFKSWLQSNYPTLHNAGHVIETNFTDPDVEDWIQTITDALNDIER